MMNDSTKYNHIRLLIERWYAGNTDRKEEMEIRNFFHDNDTDNLPEDLRQEASVFSMLNDLSAEYSDKDLLAEIEAEVIREQQPQKPRRRLSLRIAMVAAAASVAILFVIGIKTLSDKGLAVSSDMQAAYSDNITDAPSDTLNSPHLSIAETNEHRSDTDTNIKTARYPHKTAEVGNIADTSDPYGYTEIDDPEEAARILEDVNRHYSKAVAMTADAMSEPTMRSITHAPLSNPQ